MKHLLEERRHLDEGAVLELPDGITIIHHTCHNRLDSKLLEGKLMLTKYPVEKAFKKFSW